MQDARCRVKPPPVDGADAGMRKAAGLIGSGKVNDAVRVQAGVIAMLLDAEFRLRVGAEHEALVTARDEMISLSKKQQALRSETSELAPDKRIGDQSVYRGAQFLLEE